MFYALHRKSWFLPIECQAEIPVVWSSLNIALHGSGDLKSGLIWILNGQKEIGLTSPGGLGVECDHFIRGVTLHLWFESSLRYRIYMDKFILFFKL